MKTMKTDIICEPNREHVMQCWDWWDAGLDPNPRKLVYAAVKDDEGHEDVMNDNDELEKGAGDYIDVANE